MKSRIKSKDTRTVIYEQVDGIGKLKKTELFHSMMEFHHAHPELYKEYLAMKTVRQAQQTQAQTTV